MQIGRDPVGTRQTHAVVPTGRGAGVASPDHAVERVVAERLVLADDAEVREPLMLDCEVRITHRIALGAAGRHHPGRRPLPRPRRLEQPAFDFETLGSEMPLKTSGFSRSIFRILLRDTFRYSGSLPSKPRRALVRQFDCKSEKNLSFCHFLLLLLYCLSLHLHPQAGVCLHLPFPYPDQRNNCQAVEDPEQS